MIYVIYDTQTGVLISGPSEYEVEPQIAQNQGFMRVPGSALLNPPVSVWDSTLKGFKERPPIPVLEFIDRFTLEEKLSAISSDHILVKLVIFETQNADLIHLDNPRVLDGLDLLVSQNILTLNRRDEILSA
jgi:hypothetical protein